MRIDKIVLDWFVKEIIMATRHAGKYRRSPYATCTHTPQDTRIKNI